MTADTNITNTENTSDEAKNKTQDAPRTYTDVEFKSVIVQRDELKTKLRGIEEAKEAELRKIEEEKAKVS